MKEFCQMHRINLSEINWYHLNAYLILKKGVKIQYKPRKENAKHLTLVRKTLIVPKLPIHVHVSWLSYHSINGILKHVEITNNTPMVMWK